MSYKRAQERNRRLKKLYDKTKNSYGAGVWFSERKNRYIRYSCHNEWLKTHTRRTTRRRIKQNNDFYQKGNLYKKNYDYWWELL